MEKANSLTGKIVAALLGVAAAAVIARHLRPASTPPLRGRRGAKTIAKLEKVRVGGVDQWILLRSEDVVNNPVLLILHGGPGCAVMGLQRAHTQELERHFTVVNWDQRGAGKSYAAARERSEMRIDQFVEDIRELSGLLARRFGKKKIVLMGRSWGSAIGMLAVKKYPELFSAYIGIGQITDMAASEKASYDWTLYQARTNGDAKALRELKEIGPPPYSGDWLKKFNTQRKWVAHFGGEVQSNSSGGNGKIMRMVLSAPEYTLSDRLNYYKAMRESMKLLHPQLMEMNLFEIAHTVEVPVFLAEGRHDRVVPAQLAMRYFEVLEAPGKELMWFEKSAHMPDMEESERFSAWMVERVLPVAVRSSDDTLIHQPLAS